MRPIADETFRSVPVSHSNAKAPPSDNGAAARMMADAVNARNCTTSTRSTSAVAIAAHQEQLAEGPLLRFVLAADLPGVADRQLHGREHRPDLADGAAEIAALEPGTDERHLAEGSRAAALDLPALSAIVTSADTGVSCPSLPRIVVVREPRRIEALRVGIAHPDRDRPIVEAQARRDIAPSQACDNCPTTSSTVRPIRAAATGSTVHVDSTPPPCRPTTSTTPAILPSFGLDLLRQFVQPCLVVAEDLHFDRRRVALEIAEHVLEQLHELDLGVGHGRRQLVREGR